MLVAGVGIPRFDLAAADGERARVAEIPPRKPEQPSPLLLLYQGIIPLQYRNRRQRIVVHFRHHHYSFFSVE
jgi:hypothetical protein